MVHKILRVFILFCLMILVFGLLVGATLAQDGAGSGSADEVVPANVLAAMAVIMALVNQAKPLIQRLNLTDKLMKFVVWLFSIAIGIGMFLFGSGVSSSFDWILPNAPELARAILGGIILGTGGDFARLLFSIRRWGDARYLNSGADNG